MTALARHARLAAALIALGASPAMSQDETVRPAFDAALGAMTERLGPTETGPAIETTDAAANAADLAVIEQALDKLGTPAFPLDGFATFASVCEPLNALSVRHSLDGLPALARPADAPPLTPAETTAMMGKVQVLQRRNVARFMDQVIVLSGGGMRCMVKHLPTLSAFLDSLPPAELTPARLKGAEQMRQGGSQVLIGFLVTLQDPATSDRNKTRLRAFLAEVAAPLAAALTPAQRADLIAQINRLPSTGEPETEAATAALKAALAITTCEGLCRY